MDNGHNFALLVQNDVCVCVCVSAGLDVRRSDGRHPLLQGRTYIQEIRPLQGPWWDQFGQGNSPHLAGS